MARRNYLEWDDYFMGIAILSAQRSKDPVTQVGACIVDNENKIVGIGYNCMPKGLDDTFSWTKNKRAPLEHKKSYVCHAELNAIVNKNAADVKDCSMYVTLFPCNECAKLIIQSGIKRIIYKSDKYCFKSHTLAAKIMFERTGVQCQQFSTEKENISISFAEHDENHSDSD